MRPVETLSLIRGALFSGRVARAAVGQLLVNGSWECPDLTSAIIGVLAYEYGLAEIGAEER